MKTQILIASMAAAVTLSACGTHPTQAVAPAVSPIPATTLPPTTLPTPTYTVSPRPTTTAPTEGAAYLAYLITSCGVSHRFVHGEQIVVDVYGDLSDRQETEQAGNAKLCLSERLSAGDQAILNTASGALGPQSVTERGVKFTQIFVSGQTNTLIVDVAGG